MISIICLVYKSTSYADFIYEGIHQQTEELSTGEAEFYFVANDATSEVKKHLITKEYPHFTNDNEMFSEEYLFKAGYAHPEYINRVYRGYNFGIKVSENPILVLINSDMFFYDNWLKNLKNRLSEKTVVSSKMVQPHKKFKNPINGTFCEQYDCGSTLTAFDKSKFLSWAKVNCVDGVSPGNAFMPIMFYKKQAESVSYYPEGNLHDGSYDKISMTGDHSFIMKLEGHGIKHVTSNNSIVYHFQEGEKRIKI